MRRSFGFFRGFACFFFKRKNKNIIKSNFSFSSLVIKEQKELFLVYNTHYKIMQNDFLFNLFFFKMLTNFFFYLKVQNFYL